MVKDNSDVPQLALDRGQLSSCMQPQDAGLQVSTMLPGLCYHREQSVKSHQI